MTGCHLCGVGPEDDCTDDCPSRTGKRGRGRPYIGRPIEVRIPDDCREALEAQAKAEGVPLAVVIREALEQWVSVSQS